MSQWARENPEGYEQIAALPLSQQNAALRHAIGYDPDYIRDMFEGQAPGPLPHGAGTASTTSDEGGEDG